MIFLVNTLSTKMEGCSGITFPFEKLDLQFSCDCLPKLNKFSMQWVTHSIVIKQFIQKAF